jgi:serine/threonine protein kinase
MSDAQNPFTALIAAVADGLLIDWPQLEAAAKSPTERALVEKIKLVATVKDAHRQDTLPIVDGTARDAFGRTQNREPGSVRPKKWGKLQVFERIGEGGFGEVFRAMDPDLGRECALKLFWTGAGSVEALRPRVLHEARNLVRIKHPNVAALYDIGTHDDRLGMWMEYIHGLTLAEIMQLQGRLSALEATVVGLQICDALSAVHRAGVLHGDLKVQNVMREEGGRVVLMDFGATQAVGGANRTIGGTPLYIAPEILNGKTATERSDLYSLGVLLFKLVTDDYPYRGATLDEMRQAHAHGVMLRADDTRDDLPQVFVAALERALSSAPEDRFTNARAMRIALQETLGAHTQGRTPDAPLLKSNTATSETSVVARADRIGVFVSYCHEDASRIGRMDIMSYLRDLESDGCEVWSDHNLRTGDDWSEVLMDRLNRSHVLVPLVTQHYLRSRYCQEVEIRHFWNKRVRDGMVVFPIIVSACEWQRYDWLKQIQFLPRKGTLMTHFQSRGKREQFLVGALSELRYITNGLRAAEIIRLKTRDGGRRS